MGSLALRIVDLSKRFDTTQAVNGVSFDVPSSAYFCLLGPSGCGKTTILRSIAGFHVPDSGRIEIGGRDMTFVSPSKRELGMVYQNYALFPHLTVNENIAFGLKMRGHRGHEVRDRVRRVVDLVHLQDVGHRRPKELSGGQQQRVALARAIVIEPKVLLLDEPLSNLDAKLRKQMQIELKALQQRIGLTTIHVTHDQEEALTLADTVIILNNGEVIQSGPPREVYSYPNSVFVADFIGRANFVSGRAVMAPGGLACKTDHGEMLTSALPNAVRLNEPCRAFIRPENVLVESAERPLRQNGLTGRVTSLVFTGPLLSLTITVAGGRQLVVERQPSNNLTDIGVEANVNVTFPRDALLILPDN